ncbi:MAG: ASCH domain-containing protein [Nocardioidaceae bacterium]
MTAGEAPPGARRGGLENNEWQLVEAAELVVRSLRDGGDTHTVAAAAMSTTGAVFTGVNVHHFTGGPCAEMVAIGAAAQANAGPLISIVAVGDRGRGVLAPCGRCRQVLSDLHPDVYVVVPAAGGELTALPIRDLLPVGYAPPADASRPRVVYFHPRHYDSIASGQKTATVRYQEPLQPGPAVLVFDDGDEIRRLDAVVENVESRHWHRLTDDDARREALPDRDALRAAVRRQYPALADDAVVEVATFHLTSA